MPILCAKLGTLNSVNIGYSELLEHCDPCCSDFRPIDMEITKAESKVVSEFGDDIWIKSCTVRFLAIVTSISKEILLLGVTMQI